MPRVVECDPDVAETGAANGVGKRRRCDELVDLPLYLGHYSWVRMKTRESVPAWWEKYRHPEQWDDW